MFNVGNSLLGSPLAPFGGAPPNSLANAAAAGQGAAAAVLNDAISPAQQGGSNAFNGTSVYPGSANGPGGFIAQFMSVLFSAFTQLAQYVSGSFGQPPWPGSGGTPGPVPGPIMAPGQGPPATPGGGDTGQHFFTSATASSTGDPHDAFDGTRYDGRSLDGGRWNNETSHKNLLVSDSFYGGFRIGTEVTQPGKNGDVRNGSVTVASDFGRNVVTMNKDGSYTIDDDGKAVQLAVGQTQKIGDGESVTLNADKSLTIVEKNDHGGEITTTLRAANGGVNVRAEAQHADLGGYLVRESEREAHGPGTGQPGPVPGDPGSPPIAGLPISMPIGTPLQPYEPYRSSQSGQAYQPFQAEQWESPEALAGT